MMVEFDRVSFSYGSAFSLHNISFKIEDNETAGLCGPNGAGKSTVLLLLCGILFPGSGQITVDGIPVTKKNLQEMRKKIGYVFQDPDDQLFMTSVYEDVAFAPKNHGMNKTSIDSNVEYALKAMDIIHLKDSRPYNLSGGEKKRAAISTALSVRPKLLVMDEPTSMLDPRARRLLINQINILDSTKLYASHDLDMLYETCDRIILLNNGEIFDIGSRELLANEEIMLKCGLELPLSLSRR